MKKFCQWVVMFIGSLPLYGAPIGNSSAPQVLKEGLLFSNKSWLSLRAGYEGDFVEDGRMNQYDQGSGRVDTYKQWTNSGTVTLNILDHLEIYGVFGSSETKSDWRFENNTLGSVTRIEMETDPHFLWAFGGRSIIYERGKTVFGLGGRYTSSNSHPKSVSSNGTAESVVGSRVEWRAWQINFDISYKIDWFIPYIGAKYLNGQTLLKNFSIPISQELVGSDTFKNRDPVGLYLGCTLSSGKYFMLNLEGRLIDEEAITVSTDFRF